MSARARQSSTGSSLASTRPLASSLTSTLARTRPASASAPSKRVTYSNTHSHASSSASLVGGGGGPSGRRRGAAEEAAAFESELVASRLQSSLHISQSEKESMVESLAAEQNGYLLMLLEKEQANESERSRLRASISDPGDLRRLDKIFSIERAKASHVIRTVTKEHERTLALKMHELGMISDDDDDEDLMNTPR